MSLLGAARRGAPVFVVPQPKGSGAGPFSARWPPLTGVTRGNRRQRAAFGPPSAAEPLCDTANQRNFSKRIKRRFFEAGAGRSAGSLMGELVETGCGDLCVLEGIKSDFKCIFAGLFYF